MLTFEVWIAISVVKRGDQTFNEKLDHVSLAGVIGRADSVLLSFPSRRWRAEDALDEYSGHVSIGEAQNRIVRPAFTSSMIMAAGRASGRHGPREFR